MILTEVYEKAYRVRDLSDKKRKQIKKLKEEIDKEGGLRNERKSTGIKIKGYF